MPFTVNGLGTSLCGSRGNVGWGSYDGMEWIVILYMPVIPIKAVHTFNWNRNQYRAIPITWSFDLFIRTFLGRWLWGLGGLGALFLLFGVIEFANQRPTAVAFLVAAAILLGLAVALFLGLRWTDARNKATRRVLGANTIGHCDPAHLPADVLERMTGDPRVSHGADTLADAARSYFQRRAFSRAMWAARACVVLENRAEGESLTDMILHDPDVRAAIEEVRRDAKRWQPLMNAGDTQLPTEPSPARLVNVLPADTDDRVRPA